MFKKINMGEKVMGSLLLLAVIVAIAGLFGIYGMSRISKSLDEVVSVNLPGVTALEIIHEAQTAIQRDERTMLLRGTLNNEEKARLSGSMEGAWKRVASAWNIYEPLPKSQESENAWNKFKPAWEAWKNDQQKVFNLVKADRRTDATTVSLGVALKSFNRAEELLGEVISVTKKDTKAQTAGANTAASILKWVLICAIVLSIFGALTIVIRINKDMAQSLFGLRDEVRKIVDAARGGNLAVRGDPEKVNYEFQDIVKGFNDSLDACIDAAEQQVKAVQKLATGDLSVRIPERSEQDIIALSMNKAIADWDGLRNEIQRITKAAEAGMVLERGRTEHFQGAYAEIIQGVNGMLDAIDALLADTSALARVVAEGDFTKRADAAKHQGAFRQIVYNINEILDAVTEPLKIASEYKERIARGEISPKIASYSKGVVNDIFWEMLTQNKPYY